MNYYFYSEFLTENVFKIDNIFLLCDNNLEFLRVLKIVFFQLNIL